MSHEELPENSPEANIDQWGAALNKAGETRAEAVPGDSDAPEAFVGDAAEAFDAAPSEATPPVPSAQPRAEEGVSPEALLARVPCLPFLPDPPVIREMLEKAEKTLGAKSVSVLHPNEDGVSLSVMTSRGLGKTIGKSARISMERSPAGRVFRTGESVAERTLIPQTAEDDTEPRDLYRVSVPVFIHDRPVAVTSAAIEMDRGVSHEEFLPWMERFASELGVALVRVVDLGALAPGLREPFVLLQVDSTLAHEETIHQRLLDVAEVLESAFSADACNLFMMDVMAEKLQLMTAPRGMGVTSGRFQTVHTGILGWLANSPEPIFLNTEDPQTGERRGQLSLPLPIHDRLHSLFLIDDVSCPAGRVDDLMNLARSCVEQIQTTLEVELSVDSSDRSTQLRVRLADALPLIRQKHGSDRMISLLKVAADIVQGDAAVWVATEDSEPLLGPPANQFGLQVLTRAWKEIHGLTEWIREVGVGGWHPNADWVPESPQARTAYVGARDPESSGVLIVFFRPENDPPQESIDSMIETLAALCTQAEATTVAETSPVPLPEGLIDIDRLKTHLEQEWHRALRFGHFFSVTRFQCDESRDTEEEERAMLRELLTGSKRIVDVMAEGEPGVFYILSPESEKDPEGIKFRLNMLWLESHPDIPLAIEQVVFPKHGERIDFYLDWVLGKDRAEEAEVA